MKKTSLKVILLLIFTNFVSHFLYFKRFGLYEDDYGSIIPKSTPETDHIVELVISRVTNWVQGRALVFFPNLFSYISDCLGGHLYFLYILSFVIVTFSSYLMYKILKKVFPGSEIFAVVGALVFILYPPDTTKLYLLHVFILHLSMLYFLSATLLYLNGSKKLYILFLICALLTYESVFIIFLGVPLLKGRWNKEIRKELIRNFLLIAFLSICTTIYRKFTEESRIVEATGNLFDIIFKITTAMIIGPFMNLVLFLRAPIVTVSYWINDKSTWWYYDYIFYFIAFSFILYFWYIYKTKPDYVSVSEADPVTKSYEENNRIRNYFTKLYPVLIAGIVLTSLAYIVSFTHYPPTEVMGRRTSVHLAATFGASIIFAVAAAAFLFIAERYNFKKSVVVFISLYLTLLVGYNTYTQKEFVQSWNFQKAYWKKIVELCPDLKDNTVVISQAGTDFFFVTRYIWSINLVPDNVMLKSFFLFPEEWKNPPTTYSSVWGWRERIQNVDGKFVLNRPPLPPLPLQDSNIILIDLDKDNNMVRIDSTITVDGKTLHLKPKENITEVPYKTTKLYDIMINGND